MAISNVQAVKLVLFPSLLATLEQQATTNGNKLVVDLTKQIKFSTSTLVAAVAFTVTTLALTLFTSASWLLTLRVMAFIGFCFTTLTANKLLQAVQALKRVNMESQQGVITSSSNQRQEVTETKSSVSDVTHQTVCIGSKQELNDLLKSKRDLGSIRELKLEFSGQEVLEDHHIMNLFGQTGEVSFSTLQSLHLINGKFSEKGLVFLQRLPMLSNLNLKGSIVQDTRSSYEIENPFECIARIRGLEHLDISSIADLDDANLSSFASCRSLKTLSLAECPKITLNGTRRLQGSLTQLRVL